MLILSVLGVRCGLRSVLMVASATPRGRPTSVQIGGNVIRLLGAKFRLCMFRAGVFTVWHAHLLGSAGMVHREVKDRLSLIAKAFYCIRVLQQRVRAYQVTNRIGKRRPRWCEN